MSEKGNVRVVDGDDDGVHAARQPVGGDVLEGALGAIYRLFNCSCDRVWEVSGVTLQIPVEGHNRRRIPWEAQCIADGVPKIASCANRDVRVSDARRVEVPPFVEFNVRRIRPPFALPFVPPKDGECVVVCVREHKRIMCRRDALCLIYASDGKVGVGEQ